MILTSSRIVLLVVLSLVPTLVEADQMPWRTDLTAAQGEAARDGKLVLIHFWTESCGPCRLLDKRVFSEQGAVEAIVRDYVPVKVNARAQSEIAKSFNVTRVPTDVVITPTGQLVKSFVSPATPVAYVGAVTEIASSRLAGRRGFQAASTGAPFNATASADQLPGSTPVLNPAYGQLQATAVSATSPPATPTGVAPPAVQPQPQVLMNPAYTAGVAAAPVETAAPPITQPKPAAPAAPATPVLQEVVQQTVAPQPSNLASQLPPGSPPVGFDGYCAVTLKREWRWAQGDPKWGAIHRGCTYLFVSEEARNDFLKSPDTFSPAFSGNDVVLAAETGQAATGMREHGVEYEGKYYLFSSKESFDKFWSNPGAYVQRATERVATAPASGGTQIR